MVVLWMELKKNRPKIGLALSSGGARGFAHLGVIQALHEEGIPIDVIAGSSMGALIAGCYAASQDIEHLVKFAAVFQRKSYLDFEVPRLGFIKGERVRQLIQLLTHGKNIEQLTIPIAIVSTDLHTGEKIVFTNGNASEAIRSSISIPGVFLPYSYAGRTLIDGGVTTWIPVTEARGLGADIVIACNVSPENQNVKAYNVLDVINRSIEIMQIEGRRISSKEADVYLNPDLSMYSSTAFTNISEMMYSGYLTLKNNKDSIYRLIENWKGKQNE
ncbi:MAG: esterase [Bacillales bacterium]|jgi:NTE family protein|nr:esterase [Bacillales bacterium]